MTGFAPLSPEGRGEAGRGGKHSDRDLQELTLT